jgi:menaquinone-dependent protoporphyrinogen oxidase
MRVLVTAASQHGSTAEMAAEIGDVLAARGAAVTLVTPKEVQSLGGFDAFVLGSAVYMGHWLPAGKELALRVGADRADRPVWLFSSGPVGDPSHKLSRQMWVDPVDLPDLLAATGALEHKLFAGKLDRRALHGMQRAALSFFRGLEGDFRDWDAVRAWAGSIAEQLLRPPVRSLSA